MITGQLWWGTQASACFIIAAKGENHWPVSVVLKVGSLGQQPQGNLLEMQILRLPPETTNQKLWVGALPGFPHYLEFVSLHHLSPGGLPQLMPDQTGWQGIQSGSPPALASPLSACLGVRPVSAGDSQQPRFRTCSVLLLEQDGGRGGVLHRNQGEGSSPGLRDLGPCSCPCIRD